MDQQEQEQKLVSNKLDYKKQKEEKGKAKQVDNNNGKFAKIDNDRSRSSKSKRELNPTQIDRTNIEIKLNSAHNLELRNKNNTPNVPTKSIRQQSYRADVTASTKSQDKINYQKFDEQPNWMQKTTTSFNESANLNTKFNTNDMSANIHNQDNAPTSDNDIYLSDARVIRRRRSSAVAPDSGGPNIADLTGGFGYFQLFLATLVFIRYCSLALMTSSGPLLAPEVEFKCLVPDNLIDQIDLPHNETMSQFLLNRCTIPIQNNTYQYKCQHFWFNKTASGTTMTDSLELVCDRAYLKSTFQSSISLGVVLACILSGPISDQHGRLFVIRCAFLWSLFWGCVSYFANNFKLYSLSRAFVTFGDSSLVGSLSLVMIELIPAKFRGMILILVYTGWSLGVMFMPFVCDYLMNYKLATLFTIIVHLITCVPLLLVEESVRWSMVMGNFNSASSELKRIHKWNGKRPDNFEQAFSDAKEMYLSLSDPTISVHDSQEHPAKQYGCCGLILERLKTFCVGIWDSYKRIGEFFQSWKLALTTLVIVWISLNGELFYMLFVLINSDVGEAKLANYIIGFGMELLATLVGILMTSYMSRRLSILTTMIFISISCITLSWTYEMTVVSVIVMNLAKLAISNLTSLSWVLANESFPTTLRQTGSGITGSIGSFGAVAAPFVRTELTQMFGFGTVMFTLGIIVFVSSWVSLLVKETKDTELPDNLAQMVDIPIVDIEAATSGDNDIRVPSDRNVTAST